MTICVEHPKKYESFNFISNPSTSLLFSLSFCRAHFHALAAGSLSVLFIFTFASDKTLHCSPALVFIFVSRAFKLASSILLTLVFIVVQHVFLFKTPFSNKRESAHKSYNALLSLWRAQKKLSSRREKRKERREFWLACLPKIFREPKTIIDRGERCKQRDVIWPGVLENKK